MHDLFHTCSNDIMFKLQWFRSIQFSPLTDWVIGGGKGEGHEGRVSRHLLPVFSVGGHYEQFSHGQGCPLFDVVCPAAASLPATVSSTPQGALRNGFEEAVLARDKPKPSEFPSLDSCQKKFLWVHKEVYSCFASSRWSCAPSRRCGEVSQALSLG